jgi:type IV fimbrial biogenesis protein FimT
MAGKGLSLLELLVVLGLLGALLALGLPLLSPRRLSLEGAAQGLAAQVTRARLEAIRHNLHAGLHILTEGPGGYVVFLDRNGNRTYDPGEELHQVRFGQGEWAWVRLEVGQSTLGNLPLLFDPRGVPAKPIAATLALASGNAIRRVVVSQQGRPRVE